MIILYEIKKFIFCETSPSSAFKRVPLLLNINFFCSPTGSDSMKLKRFKWNIHDYIIWDQENSLSVKLRLLLYSNFVRVLWNSRYLNEIFMIILYEIKKILEKRYIDLLTIYGRWHHEWKCLRFGAALQRTCLYCAYIEGF